MPAIRELMNNPMLAQQEYANLYNSNPQFRAFADSMSGKSPQQAFAENGKNFDVFMQELMR